MGALSERKGRRLKALRECHHTKVARKDAEEISLKLKSRPARVSPIQRSPDVRRGDESAN